MVFLFDRDYIEHINFYRFGATFVFEETLRWLIKQVENNIRCRTTQMVDKKPEALCTDSPKLVLVKMIK